MADTMNVSDYMTEKPITFKPDDDIFQAIHIILEKKISGATVIDENSKIVGTISELDCLKAILDASYYGEARGSVADYMITENIVTVKPSISLTDIAKMILDQGHRRIPVVKDDKFVGQFSCRSVLKAVKDITLPKDRSERVRSE